MKRPRFGYSRVALTFSEMEHVVDTSPRAALSLHGRKVGNDDLGRAVYLLLAADAEKITALLAGIATTTTSE